MDVFSKLVTNRGVKRILEELIAWIDNSDEEYAKELVKDLQQALKNYEGRYTKKKGKWKCAFWNSHEWVYDSDRDAEITWRTCERCNGRQRGVRRQFGTTTTWDWA